MEDATTVGPPGAKASKGDGGSTKRHRRITRANVLDAAEAVFKKKGFHATSVQDIAAEAGYTTGALYSSFKGKDDLFVAILERRREEREQLWRDALEEARNSPTGGAAIGATLMNPPAWYGGTLEFVVHASRTPELSHMVPRVSGYSTRESFFKDALEDVTSSPLPPERLGPIIWALILGFSESWFAEPEIADPSLFADAIAVLLGTRPTGANPGTSSEGPQKKKRGTLQVGSSARSTRSQRRNGREA